MTKVYSEIPPLFGKLQIWDDQSLLRNTPLPHFWKTSDLGWPKFTPKYPPPILENFRFGMTKVYLEISPPPPFWKTSDLGWPKFTPKYPPPILENFRFGMTKVYSEIPSPHFGKLQIWDDQSLLRNTPPTPSPPIFGKLQIWDDQSLLRNTPPPFWKTSDLGWPKFTPKYPPHFGKLQIWDDQSLLRNTPPQPKIVKEFKSKIFRIPRVTTCGDFIQPG